MSPPPLPGPGSLEYLWWSRGAEDEAKASREALGPKAAEVRETLDAFAAGYGKAVSAEALLTGLMRIYCPERLRRKFRS